MLSLSLSLSLSSPLLTERRQVFRHHSALARCHVHQRVLRIDYSGAISNLGFARLDLAVLPLRQAALVAYERLDKALTVVSQTTEPGVAWPPDTPPSVVVVRPDQWQMERDFCLRLAQRGVVRLAFLPAQEDMAWALVARIAAAQPLPE